LFEIAFPGHRRYTNVKPGVHDTAKVSVGCSN